MSSLVAVDPGLNGCGVSVWAGQNLIRAFYAASIYAGDTSVELGVRIDDTAHEVFSSVRKVLGTAPWILACEWPRVYRGHRVTGHALLSLAGVVGVIMGRFPNARKRLVEPPDWKGSLDPDAMIERIRGRLTQEERERVIVPRNTCEACRRQTPPFTACKQRSCLAHNVFDAIGIGLWAVGRLTARKAVAR